MSKAEVKITARKPGAQEKAITLFAMMIDAVVDLKPKPGEWCRISVSALEGLERTEDWFDIVGEAAEIILGAPFDKVADRYYYCGHLVNAMHLDSDEGLSFEVSRELVEISHGALWKNEVDGDDES